MKILHIGQLIGGLDIYIRNSIVYADNSFDYVVVHGKNDKSSPIEKNGKLIKTYRISLYRSLNPIKDLIGLWQAIRIIKIENPDIIHCHSAKGGFIGRLAGFITGTKTYYTPHAFSFLSTQNKLKRWFFLFLEKIAKFNSYLLACSVSERQLGIDVVSYKKEHALVWSNSVPKPEKIQEPDSLSSPYICYIGRPSYQKNTLFLLEVIKGVHMEHPEIKFILLGVGFYSPDLEELKLRVKEFQLEEVIMLLPWLSHEETLGYVKNSLFYLTVARYEGLPLAVIEAMSLGKAIVASNVVGNKDCVKNEVNGFLLPIEVGAFIDKINILIDNEALRSGFEEKSQEYFESCFFIENRIKYLENIYAAK